MRIVISALCGLFASVTILTAQTQPVTTLSNAELFSRQYVQADTIKPNIESTIASSNEENSLPYKRRVNNGSIIKTTASGTMWGGVGLLVGGGVGVMAGMIYTDPSGTESNSENWAGLLGGVVGAGIGTVAGCSYGVYGTGKKYRKGSYWHALAGTVLPSLAVAGATALLSDKNRSNMDATLITFALAPITSTAAYYIFSKELPDTLKTP
ncbi:MAG: hypothetical protein A2509_02945 [Candidatus Edwardsbacteria bacterium RIFOXYD12_FULL_50_11]|uniref:Sulphur transport domain-containing protein n=1 Tax=Candidatus Edwardsbacteria bacterium GWF2_54_11 TaxID=1817851 RepID=A0A1F5RI23_9BACT|nr:MAG: hypothetical protein A2502_06810 [Candidatus Edwardsbacteria bacterium RifOxyC12_full_54_24]OGF06993.1 MAG: hypothetical protein A2273_08620 [Candidatus Edwardsbacteria bacterium RifOxyA12_full_54_48]OGF11041.1 MAG: hypothetical protein A3K15_07890 [Candidatus Edwardsbacteria bacterium GWE2_54_12]OGF14060.1 MAG: hypothetical protein A2024_05875 [Candidatus Edwardsbacteria bacterium GWF2_54_11]OGF15987.1 MAG: hypothetical protein A2509_02945 [Candidatus Edwardsbacteria bacterium RIFOXYD1